MDFSKPPDIEDITSKASNGDPYYQGLLGLYFLRGYFVQKDKQQAEKWAKLSAERNHPFGLYCLDELYGFHACVYEYENVNEYSRNFLAGMTSLAEAGDAEAQYCLGLCYAYGAVVPGNLAKAVELIRKAADQGLAEAQWSLGLCYENGNGVPRDFTKAAEWFHKAANQGYDYAQNSLGYCYENGEGVPQDFTKAVEWFRKAADQGLAGAQKNLGFCYEKGYGVPKDLAKATEWYQKAANQKDKADQEAPDTVAPEQLSTDIDKNITDAKQQYEMGNKYVPKDLAKAAAWYRKAADQGYAKAQYRLAQFYEDGWGVKKDFTKALEWYQKAADQGNVKAQYHLGFCYKYGRNVPQDLGKAVEWYQKAADQGDVYAQEVIIQSPLIQNYLKTNSLTTAK